MTLEQVLDLTKQILMVIGGASVVVAGLAYFLGHIWANRILDRERDKRQQDLERLRADLTSQLRQVEHELAVQREKNMSVHELKLSLYRAAVEPIIKLVNDINNSLLHKEQLPRFEHERLQVYANLAMFAPSNVLDAYSTLCDYILDCLEGKQQYAWVQLRTLSLDVFNKIRADVGHATDPVSYKGHR